MPEKKTIQKAQKDLKQGKSPTTAAGEFVHEEIEHVRRGKHGARSTQQAIAIGLSKARRAGVPLAPPKAGQASESTRRSAERDVEVGQGTRKRRPSPKRSQATRQALKREPRAAASTKALSQQAKSAAARRRATKKAGTTAARSGTSRQNGAGATARGNASSQGSNGKSARSAATPRTAATPRSARGATPTRRKTGSSTRRSRPQSATA